MMDWKGVAPTGPAILLLIAVAACSGGASATREEPKATVSAPRAKTAKPGNQPPGEMTFPRCDGTPCMLHSGSGRYHLCLSAAAGMCAHFGSTCEPADRCMFHAGDRRYRSCDRSDEGSCVNWGAPCTPASTCRIDPRDHHYRECLERGAPGECQSFGSPCAPGAPEPPPSASASR